MTVKHTRKEQGIKMQHGNERAVGLSMQSAAATTHQNEPFSCSDSAVLESNCS